MEAAAAGAGGQEAVSDLSGPARPGWAVPLPWSPEERRGRGLQEARGEVRGEDAVVLRGGEAPGLASVSPLSLVSELCREMGKKCQSRASARLRALENRSPRPLPRGCCGRGCWDQPGAANSARPVSGEGLVITCKALTCLSSPSSHPLLCFRTQGFWCQCMWFKLLLFPNRNVVGRRQSEF